MTLKEEMSGRLQKLGITMSVGDILSLLQGEFGPTSCPGIQPLLGGVGFRVRHKLFEVTLYLCDRGWGARLWSLNMSCSDFLEVKPLSEVLHDVKAHLAALGWRPLV